MDPDWRPPGPRTWKADYSLDYTAVHVRPRNDRIWHILSDECPCGPASHYLDLDAPAARWLIIHAALDGRGGPYGGLTPRPGPCHRAHNDDGDGDDGGGVRVA